MASVKTTYLVDTQNPTGYAQVITETTGNTTQQYVLGLERVSERIAGGTTTTRFYDYDGHGSVRALTDTTGAVTDTYDYNAFGNLIHSTGNTPNNYLFAGEQFDPDLHLYYNRARYLNAPTGRFWTRDLLEGDQFDPFSLHGYLYANVDPVDRQDRSGLQSTVEVAEVEAIEITEQDLALPLLGALCAVSYTLPIGLEAVGIDLPQKGPCSPKRGAPYVLYHYTPFPNVEKIRSDGLLKASVDVLRDAKYGPGQYFTDIKPSEAAGHTKGQLSYALYGLPFAFGKDDVGYLGIDVSGKKVNRVSSVYGPTFPGKGIFLRPSVTNLFLTDRIVDFGVVSFSDK